MLTSKISFVSSPENGINLLFDLFDLFDISDIKKSKQKQKHIPRDIIYEIIVQVSYSIENIYQSYQHIIFLEYIENNHVINLLKKKEKNLDLKVNFLGYLFDQKNIIHEIYQTDYLIIPPKPKISRFLQPDNHSDEKKLTKKSKIKQNKIKHDDNKQYDKSDVMIEYVDFCEINSTKNEELEKKLIDFEREKLKRIFDSKNDNQMISFFKEHDFSDKLKEEMLCSDSTKKSKSKI